MRLLADVSIRTRLTTLLVGLATLVAVLAAAILGVVQVRQIRSLMVVRQEALAKVLGESCAAALAFGVPSTAQEILAPLHVDPITVFVCVYDARGAVFAVHRDPGHEAIEPPPRPAEDGQRFTREGFLELVQPIEHGGVRIGTIFVRSSMDPLRELYRQLFLVGGVVILLCLGSSLALALVLQRVISAPIDRLVAEVRQFTPQPETTVLRLGPRPADEIRRLQEDFTAMVEAIRSRDAELEGHRRQLERLVAERTRELELKTNLALRTAGELSDANIELGRINRELDQFTYLTSHDLQEPTRKMIAYGDLLRKDVGTGLPARAAQDLDFIIDAAQRMQRLVQDLLALSRLGRTALRSERVSLDACVDSAIDLHSERVAEVGARIERDALPVVIGDGTILKQVYFNLLGNALKFVKPGQAVEVRMTAERTDEGCVLGVRDNGIGVPPDYAEQIFQPFRRLHGRDIYPGSGIGLALCQKAVELHGGRIWVESEGQGAHFKFTLPQPMAEG